MKKPNSLAAAETALRRLGIVLPEVTEDFPWGHRALKVRGKMFLVMSLEQHTLRVSMKLPDSNAIALSMPFTEPTGYGMGRSGWVTSSFQSPSEVPLPLLTAWLDESYRAIAPKRLSKSLPYQSQQLEASIKAPSPRRKSSRSRNK